VRFLLRLAVTAILFSLILWQLDPRAILERVQSPRAGSLVLVALLLGCQFLVATWRWKQLVDRVSNQSPSYWILCRFMGASNLYGQLLPSTIGGDLVRAGLLSRFIGLGPATLSVLLDRMAGLATLLAFTIVLLPALAWRIEQTSVVLGLLALGLAGLAVLAGFLLLERPLASSWFPRAAAHVRTFIAQSRAALLDRTLAPVVIASGVLVHLGSVTLVFLLGRAIGVPLGFFECLLLVPPALLIAAVPISLAGWGVREGVLAGGFALIGMNPADIVVVSILYGLTAPAIGLIYGAIALVQGDLASTRPAPPIS
jgi:glycosyltransferase 2 family protein